MTLIGPLLSSASRPSYKTPMRRPDITRQERVMPEKPKPNQPHRKTNKPREKKKPLNSIRTMIAPDALRRAAGPWLPILAAAGAEVGIK